MLFDMAATKSKPALPLVAFLKLYNFNPFFNDLKKNFITHFINLLFLKKETISFISFKET